MRKGSKHTPGALAKMSAAHKGKKFSAEHKAKLSAVQKGKKRGPHSDETKTKISAANKGKKRSDEHRVKISAAMTGRVFSKEHSARKSEAQMGPKNPNWQGGISEKPYPFGFNRSLKKQVRDRDGNKCQLCGVPQLECSQTLAVHHIDYDKQNSDLVNLITLCSWCHGRTSTNRDHWTTVFQHVMIERTLEQI